MVALVLRLSRALSHDLERIPVNSVSIRARVTLARRDALGTKNVWSHSVMTLHYVSSGTGYIAGGSSDHHPGGSSDHQAAAPM